jgi:hypothetical protein
MPDRSILVIAKHSVLGALLGSLVELAGHEPVFPDLGETPSEALLRLRPSLMLLDCAHAAAWDDETYRHAALLDVPLLLFSSSRTQAEAHDIAGRRGAKAFGLPIQFRAFERLLSVSLAAPRAG